MNYIAHLLVLFCVYSILAMGLNLIVGYCGLLSLAHAAYFAIGAYVYAIGTSTFGLGFVPALLLAASAGALLSLLISLPAWRFKGDYFLLVSLAVQAVIYGVLDNWASPDAKLGTWANLTNGPLGIADVSKPAILGYRFDTPGDMCAVAIPLAVGCAIFCWLLVRSPWGRLVRAMRDDELAARSLGKNTRLAKVQAMGVACAMASVAGVIYVSYVSSVYPTSGSLGESILMFCMVVVGGVGNFRGPFVGAFLLLGIPEVLRFVAIPPSIAAEIRLMAYGLLLVLMAHFRPQGVAGEYRME